MFILGSYQSRPEPVTPSRDGPSAFPVLLLVLFLAQAGLSGCASTAISRSFQETVNPAVTFESLLVRPDAYRGQRVVLGGYVLDVTNMPDRSAITVLQTPLDSFLEPEEREESRGRFIIESNRFIDPEVYTKGRRVTVGGTVIGSRTQKMGETEYTYTYPVVEAQELHLWQRYRADRRLSPFHDPWYHGYWRDDFYSPFHYYGGPFRYRHYPGYRWW